MVGAETRSDDAHAADEMITLNSTNLQPAGCAALLWSCRASRPALLAGAVLLGLLLAPAAGVAQTERAPGTISVRVTTSAGPAAGVLVVLLAGADTTVLRGEVSDAQGQVAFTGVPAGPYTVRAERLGYGTVARAVDVTAGATRQVQLALTESVLDLPGVMVEAERRRVRFEEAAGATVTELTQRELKLLPRVGEADVLRAVQSLPGVVSTSDFSSAFNVRGGSADQNLILLDGLPIYNPFHLGGLFSIFNADMVARAELLSGGFGAEHGGRVASVLSVESDAGLPGVDVQAGVSLLATRVALGADLPAALLEGAGLRSGRARLSLRRSYFDQLLRPFFDFPYYLTDVQGYAELWTRGDGRLSITGYTGRDVLDLAGTESFPLQVRWNWGNDMIGAAWVRPLGADRLLDVRLGYSGFATGIRFPEFGDTEFRGRIGQLLLRADLSSRVGAARLQVGTAVDRLAYDNLATTGGTRFGGGNDVGWLLGEYAQASWRRDAWLLEAGLRGDVWLPGSAAAAVVVQPRAAVKRFVGGGDFAVKASVGRYAQFVHSLRDEELPLGIDVWVLAGLRAPHVVSDQVQLGVEGYPSAAWYGAVEAYYRSFAGVTALNPADDPNDPADDLLAGRGASYGADFSLRRDAGRVRPTLAVSWLRAWREFDDPLTAEDPPPTLRYAPIFDRRVNINLGLQALLPRGVELGASWTLGTGLPFTRPIAAHVYYDYSLQDGAWRLQEGGRDTARSAVVLGPRNAERYPPYHRLDLGVRKTYRRSWGTITPHFDIVNAYDRRNVLFYFYQYSDDPPTRAGISMFPFLPTFGAEARF
jgi:hypothetical protein